MEILIGIAVAVCMFGGLALFQRASVASKKGAVLAAHVTSVAAANDGGRVMLRGRAHPLDEGPTEAPLCGRRVVWWRTRVEVRAPRSRLQYPTNASELPQWRRFHEDTADCDLQLEDEGGELARVTMAGAQVHLPEVVWPIDSPEAAAFLRARGIANDAFELGGERPEIRVFEQCIEVEMELYVLGTVTREGGPAAKDAYRASPLARVILRPGRDADASPVLVATEDIRVLVAEERFGDAEIADEKPSPSDPAAA